MDWDARLYDGSHDFVAAYGENLLAYVPDGLDFIVDVGCGTGTLTQKLAAKARRVVGLDASPDMISQARELAPQMEFMVMDACLMPWNGSVDAIFSNAALHWIEKQQELTAAMFRALRPGGLLVCEFGAHGNIGSIRKAFGRVYRKWFQAKDGAAVPLRAERFYFPTAEEHAKLLERNGFTVRLVEEYDRPTPLKGGEDGLDRWMTQFFEEDLSRVETSARQEISDAVAAMLRATLWDGGQWIADYRRLRVVAVKN